MSYPDIIEQARRASLDLLAACATPNGFVASAEFDHYRAVWARDACITGIGALRSGDPHLIETAIATVRTLGQHATPLGQIPNTVWPEQGYWDFGENGSVDATLWWLVLAAELGHTTHRARLVDEFRTRIEAAARWLRGLDVTGTGLISAPAASDWMDSSLNRPGRSLYNNVLFVWALRRLEALDAHLILGPGPDATELSRIVDGFFWPDAAVDLSSFLIHRPPGEQWRFPHPALRASYVEASHPGRRTYVSHVTWGRHSSSVDVLGQLLAILSGVASPERTERILTHLAEDLEVDTPFPSRVVDPSQTARDPDRMLDPVADLHQDPRWRNPPDEYHNGAVWPFVGGVHVAVEAAYGDPTRALVRLEACANGNLGPDGAWAFPEWRHAKTAALGGATLQAWNAGTLLWALSETDRFAR